jgi:polyhydroxybutyrate depolymerase
VPAVHWLLEDKNAVVLWYAVPWILGGLAAFKMSAAALLATRLYRGRVVGDRTLVAGAASWSVVVLALYGVLVWLMSTPPVIPRHIPALVAILAVPLVRPAATPLALAWNRHRGSRPAAATTEGRPVVVAAVLLLVGLPAALALAEAASFYVLNRNNGTIVSAGREREYLLYVPRSYDRTRPTPLVISMHGGAMWPAQQQEVSGWNEVAEAEGFIVVYPSGTSRRGPRRWVVDGGAEHLADVRFISDLIDTLEAAYNIDPTRIYADGFSNGGGMAFALSCTMPDRIAAVGMVASAQFRPWSSCTDRRPVPMIAFHGTADTAVPYHGGESWAAPTAMPDIPAWVATWARRNRCAPTPVDEVVAPDVVCRSYADCAGDASVVLYTLEGGGHTWPGGAPLPEWFVGRTCRSVDATRLMWAFFREHPLPAARDEARQR